MNEFAVGEAGAGDGTNPCWLTPADGQKLPKISVNGAVLSARTAAFAGGSVGKARLHTMPDLPAPPNSIAADERPGDDGFVAAVMADIDASPSPYHAASHAAALLKAAGFSEVVRTDALPPAVGGYYLRHGGGLVAWIIEPSSTLAFRVVGAHTDSPNLRVRTNPDVSSAGWAQVGVETYGGLLANSWLDRDLGIAGRVTVREEVARSEARAVEVLVRDDRPVLRIPQLAIHLDRDIRDKGLHLNPQQHLTPLWALGDADEGDFAAHVAELADVEVGSLLSWELMAFDLQQAALVGRDSDLIASARIDNQLSCFTATRALCASLESADSDVGRPTPVLALYDHEEVGSASYTGAAGAFLADLLERISASLQRSRIEHLEALAASVVVSADGAHATHPNYADRHEPNHQIVMNGGVVIKRNANQRYATDAGSEGWMRLGCAEAEVPVHTYIHRNDLPCGSTIGPITAAELAVPTVDIGAPQLAMHSIRELAGVADTEHLGLILQRVWAFSGR